MALNSPEPRLLPSGRRADVHLAAVRTPKTGEVVAESIRHQIARGELAIGQRLPPEDELTELFGVARTTLREALRILESQGLIEIRRGRSGGPVVTMPRVEALAEGLAVTLQLQGATVGDLDGARQMVEPALAAELARSHSPADVTAMECAIDDAARAADTVDQEAFGAAAAAVHETLVERAGNRTLATFSRLLHELVTHYYRNAATGADGPTMQRAVRSYRKLVTLIAAGDASGAADHWRRHMRFTIDRRDADQPLRLFDT